MQTTGEQNDSLTIYEIPARNLPGLLFKIEKLSKKSQKLIGKPITLNIIKDIRRPKLSPSGTRILGLDGAVITQVFHQVSISAEIPRIAGWTFVATLDHLSSNGNIIRLVPNTVASLPERFRTVGPICEHCNKHRTRRDTYVLRNDETGALKQIASTCIRDFIGYDPKRAVELAQWLTSAQPSDDDEDADFSNAMRDRRYISVPTYLAHVCAMIRSNGWKSRKDAEFQGGSSTASQAMMNMFPLRGDSVVPLTDRDLDLAADALAWVATINPRSNYDRNLKLAASEAFIEPRTTGVLASLINAYHRALELEIKRSQARTFAKGSVHVGALKERLRDVPVTLYGAPRTFEGRFGLTHLYRFIDTNGNVYVWYASSDQEIEQSAKLLLTGTVKAHNVYEGVNQTVVSRCLCNAPEKGVIYGD